MNEKTERSEFVAMLTRMNDEQRDQLREIMTDMIRKNEQTQATAQTE